MFFKLSGTAKHRFLDYGVTLIRSLQKKNLCQLQQVLRKKEGGNETETETENLSKSLAILSVTQDSLLS